MAWATQVSPLSRTLQTAAAVFVRAESSAPNRYVNGKPDPPPPPLNMSAQAVAESHIAPGSLLHEVYARGLSSHSTPPFVAVEVREPPSSSLL